VKQGSLSFERFLSEEVSLAYGPGWTGTIEKRITERAHTTHALQVFNALGDTVNLPIRASQSITGSAFQYLVYGAGRRLLMMWHAYRNVVVYSAPPNRLEPLTADESNELTRDLNVIYINIRGTLDNLAWALLHEYAPEKVKNSKSSIGLFNPCISKDDRFKQLTSVLAPHRDWNTDLAKRRDPSAHRIPLTIPPQVLTEKEGLLFFEFLKDFEHAAQILEFSRADEAFKKTERLGRFIPYFLHDVDDGPFPIYPTLPEDVAHTVEICRDVARFLSPNL
jgi:hypothetical protein